MARKAIELAKCYQGDLPSPQNIDMELVCWKTKWDAAGIVLPNMPQEALAHADSTYLHKQTSKDSLHAACNQLLM